MSTFSPVAKISAFTSSPTLKFEISSNLNSLKCFLFSNLDFAKCPASGLLICFALTSPYPNWIALYPSVSTVLT